MPSPQDPAALLLRDAMQSGFDPVKLRGLRESRLSELEHLGSPQISSTFTPMTRDTPYVVSGASVGDAQRLRDEIANDPYTGQDEQDRVARTTNALDQAATIQRPEIADAADTTAQRNAFAEFLKAQGQSRGKALGTAEGEWSDPAQHVADADNARKVNEAFALGAGRRTGAGSGAGGANVDAQSPYAQEHALRTVQSVDELSGKVNRWTTGFGSILSHIPETDARNFKAELDTLKANIAFGELTAMREASKTGGALGQVSDRELNLLSSALGALDVGQSPVNLKAQLGKIKDSLTRWHAVAGGQSAQPDPYADPNWGSDAAGR